MRRSHCLNLSAAIGILALYTLVLFPTNAAAQQYPSRNISLITPVAPGTPFDLLARIFAERLRQKLGVSVVIENVTGGQGLIATQRVLNSKSDGHTLLVTSLALTTTPLIVKNAGYKAEDFTPIAPLGQVPYIVFVNSSVPATDVPSLISYLRSNIKNVNCGVLTTSHLGILLARKFGAVAGGELTEINYRGSGEMTAALLANDIQMIPTTYSVARPHLASGKLKAIGVVGHQRTHKMPELPTFKEKGYPSLYTSVWEGVFAKVDVPSEVLAKIRAASQEVVLDPAYLKAMEPTGMEPWPVPFDKLQAAIDEDTREFKADAEKFNLKFD